jgi:hypothetical protein
MSNMKLSTINNSAPATISFSWQDEIVNISYYPGRITNAWNERIRTTPLLEMLPEVLAGWDIVDDDGDPCAPDPRLSRTEYVTAWRALLAQTNVVFQQAIFNAIVDDFTQAPPAKTA